MQFSSEQCDLGPILHSHHNIINYAFNIHHEFLYAVYPAFGYEMY